MFGFLRPLFPRGCNIKQGLLVRSSHRSRKPNAISHELPIFPGFQQRRLLSPPETATCQSWNFVLQQLCERNLYGNQRLRRFYRCVRRRDMCRHFLPSTTVDMRRNASDLPSRPRIPSVKAAPLRLRRFRTRRQKREKNPGNVTRYPLVAGCLFFAAAAIDYFHDSRTALRHWFIGRISQTHYVSVDHSRKPKVPRPG